MVPVHGKEEMSAVDEEFMICKVCLENFDSVKRQPKQLPCTHIYCHRCVDNFLLKGKSKRVTCPICNQSSKCCGSSEIKTCQHSINLVNTFKHLLTRRSLKPKSCQDRCESDMDAFGVEKSKRTVVKSSNPLLHPSKKWSKMTWSDDEGDADDGELVGIKNMTLKSQPSFDEVDFNPLIDAPKSLKNLWNQHSPEVVSPPEHVDLHLDGGSAVTRNNFSTSPNSNSTVQSINALELRSYPSIQHQSDANQFSAEVDESDDLDWNYFTQNFEPSPKSTMTYSSHKESKQQILQSNAKDLPRFKTDDQNGAPSDVFTELKFTAPSLIRSSLTGDLVLIVDKTGKMENKVQVFDANSVIKHTFNVNLEINDVCLVESEDKVAVAVASKEGITIFETEMDGKGKLIPVGPANFVSPFMKGFVTAQDNSLSFCLDLSCSLVLQSIRSIHLESASTDGNIFRRIIDMNTCQNMIGLLTSDQCILIDQHGKVLQSVRLFEAESSGAKAAMQLSFTPSFRKLAVIHKSKLLAELQDIGPLTSKIPIILPLGESGNRFEVLGGTLIGEDRLLAILQTKENFRIAKYNI